MYVDTKGVVARGVYLALREEPKEGEDSNGASNKAVIIALSVVGFMLMSGVLWMIWALIMRKKYANAKE